MLTRDIRNFPAAQTSSTTPSTTRIFITRTSFTTPSRCGASATGRSSVTSNQGTGSTGNDTALSVCGTDVAGRNAITAERGTNVARHRTDSSERKSRRISLIGSSVKILVGTTAGNTMVPNMGANPSVQLLYIFVFLICHFQVLRLVYQNFFYLFKDYFLTTMLNLTPIPILLMITPQPHSTRFSYCSQTKTSAVPFKFPLLLYIHALISILVLSWMPRVMLFDRYKI